MKDEYKLLLGAVIVILIVLVGVFALSGSGGPGPAVSPTVTPTNTPTATPTIAPVGPASPTPSVSPIFTPTPLPESGVILTDWGYWITYPPLGPQNWSGLNKRPASTNIVYFDPTSASMSSDIIWKRVPDSVLARVLRTGDLSGTVTVNLSMTMSSNIVWGAYDDAPYPGTPSNIDYVTTMFDYYGSGNLTELSDGHYQVVFGPGVTEQWVGVGAFSNDESASTSPPDGWVVVTITGADGGYGVGAAKDFTVNIESLPMVFFDDDANWGELYWVDDEPASFGYFASPPVKNGDMVDVFISINRNTDVGDLTVNLENYPYNDGDTLIEHGAIIPSTYTFNAGEWDGAIKISIPAICIGEHTHLWKIFIANGDGYLRGGMGPDTYDLGINAAL